MRKRRGAGFSAAIGIALVLTASAGATFPGVAGLIVGDGGTSNLNQVPQIVVVSAAGGPANAIGYGSEPKWSPDGSHLAYGTVDGLVLASVDGRRMASHRFLVVWRPVVANGDTYLFSDYEPSWSPRGRMIAYVIGAAGSQQTDIHVVRVSDGKGMKQLTYSTSLEYNESPAWSPDGRTIAYDSCIRLSADTTLAGTCAIMLMNADGSHKRVIVRPRKPLIATDPIWSPDGTQLAYSLCSDTRCSGRILDLRSHRTTTSPGLGLDTWSPGGSRIVYFGSRSTPSCDHQEIVAHTDGSSPHALPGCFGQADWQSLP